MLWKTLKQLAIILLRKLPYLKSNNNINLNNEKIDEIKDNIHEDQDQDKDCILEQNN